MTAENSPLPLTQNSIAHSSEAGPGALIRQGRERARMSVDELAAATKLGRNQIDALERDDFSSLLEPVYVRGYYRKCAKILGLQDADLIKAYDTRVAPKPVEAPSKLRLASGTDLGSGSRLPIPMALVAAGFAVVVCMFLWNIFKAPEAPATLTTLTPQTTTLTVEPAPVVITPAPVLTTSDTPVVTTTDSAPAAAPVPLTQTAPVTSAPLVPVAPVAPAATPTPATVAPVMTPKPALAATPVSPTVAAPKPQPAVAPAPVAPAPVAPAPKPVAAKPVEDSKPAVSSAVSENPLTLSASITSWVRVEDSQGKTLINSLMRSGEKKTLSGSVPYKVFLGNAPGVRLEYKGKIQDISNDIADNLTARVTVPAN